jgi:hypothetical protein
MSAILDRDALHYPYIHIRDVNWLKGTPLCFPQVRRMVPPDFHPSRKGKKRGQEKGTGCFSWRKAALTGNSNMADTVELTTPKPL